MDNDKLIKHLEEKKKYAEEKYKQYEEKQMIRQAEWYAGYEQAFIEVINYLKKH